MIYTNINRQYSPYVIRISFFIAIIIQIIPCPLQLLNLPQPSWINLILMYWIIRLPNQINIGTGFGIGLITDLILGPILGIRAITLSIIAYLLLITKCSLLYTSPFWKKGLVITLFSLKIHMMIYLSNIFISTKNIIFYSEILIHNILINSIIDGITWSGIFLLMNKIHIYNSTIKK